MVEDKIGINVIPRARGLDLETLRGLEKALGLTHGLGAHRLHAICMGMHVYQPPPPPLPLMRGTPILLH